MRKKILAGILGICLVLGCAACGDSKEQGSESGQTTTAAKVTEAGKTEVSTTETKVTEAKTTEATSAEAKTTEAPVTEAKTTEAPATEQVTASKPDSPAISGRADADKGTGDPDWLDEGSVAPNFTVDLVGGGTFHMSDYDDKIVLMNFWATWCPPCVNEMPAFQRLQEEGIEDLEIICINNAENKSDVDRFVKENGYTFSVGYDIDRKVKTYYPSSGVPFTLVINHGVISYIQEGALDADSQYDIYKEAIEDCRK